MSRGGSAEYGVGRPVKRREREPLTKRHGPRLLREEPKRTNARRDIFLLKVILHSPQDRGKPIARARGRGQDQGDLSRRREAERRL